MVTSVPSPLLRYSLQRDNCSAESVVKVKAVVSHVVSHKTEGDFRGVCDFSRSREGAGGGGGGSKYMSGRHDSSIYLPLRNVFVKECTRAHAISRRTVVVVSRAALRQLEFRSTPRNGSRYRQR
jgi:hypothetical protein